MWATPAVSDRAPEAVLGGIGGRGGDGDSIIDGGMGGGVLGHIVKFVVV